MVSRSDTERGCWKEKALGLSKAVSPVGGDSISILRFRRDENVEDLATPRKDQVQHQVSLLAIQLSYPNLPRLLPELRSTPSSNANDSSLLNLPIKSASFSPRIEASLLSLAFLVLPLDNRSPDDAKIKQKMLYASSKDALRKALVGISTEIQGTDFSEVAYETGEFQFKQSDGGRTKDQGEQRLIEGMEIKCLIYCFWLLRSSAGQQWRSHSSGRGKLIRKARD